MALTGFDWCFIAIAGFCTVMGLRRGLIHEGLGLLVWAVAFLAANRYCGALAPHLPAMFASEELRLIVAFAALILGCVLVGGLVVRTLKSMIDWAGMGGFNHVLGALFGALKATAILVLLNVVIPMTPFGQMSGWQHSVLRPMIAQAQGVLTGRLGTLLHQAFDEHVLPAARKAEEVGTQAASEIIKPQLQR